ncbi:MAG TPA: sugar phosphate isomerase/epimerase [Sphingobacteriaceae bacterium]
MKRIILCLIAIFALAPFSYGQMQEIGVVSYTFRDSFSKDVPGTLDKIKAMGITNIEFSSLFGKTAQELKDLLDARGMRCTSLGVSYNDLLNKSEQVISNAKTLGASFVRIGSIPHSGPLTEEVVKKAADDFNSFGALLKKNGLEFCFHNHAVEFLPAKGLINGTFYDYLIQKTNPDYVSFEIDIYWVYYPGHDPVALLKKYPDRFKLMHLKDLKKGVARNPEGKGSSADYNVAVGTGQLDIKAILKAARATSIKYFYLEDESSSVDQQVPQSLKYLKEISN